MTITFAWVNQSRQVRKGQAVHRVFLNNGYKGFQIVENEKPEEHI